MTHTLLFTFWSACFHVVKDGKILVLDPVTGHCGRHCIVHHACMFIHPGMHANSDTETVICMRGLHYGENRFTSTKAVFNPNKRGIGEKSPTFVQHNFTP